MSSIKNKKIIFIFLAVILLIGIGSTLAYFNNALDISNIFTSATFEMSVDEEFTSPSNWKPGDTTSKSITVTNDSNIPIKVRLSYTEEWYDENNNPLPLVHDGEKVAIINLANTSDWTKSGEYYYYNGTLAVDDTTSSFISGVTFNPNYTGDIECTSSNGGNTKTCLSTGNSYDGGTYHLKINVETADPNNYQLVWNVSDTEIANPTKYVLTFDSNGGSLTTFTKTVENGEVYGALPTTTKNVYKFLGWYLDSEFTNEITESTTVALNEDKIVYAKWLLPICKRLTAYKI